MKIVYLHQYYRTPEQSGGTRSWEFARRLADRGHEVHVVTSDMDCPPGAPPWRTTTEAGATVHWAAVPYSNSMNIGRRAQAFWSFAWRAAAKAATLPQDIVYASSTPLTIALPGAYSAYRNRVPMVFEVRDLWPEVPIALGALNSSVLRRISWQLEAWAYRRSAHVVALSPDMVRSIRARFPDVVVSCIPNSCDTELFASAESKGVDLRASISWLGARPLVLYAGTLGKVNDVRYLAKMARTLLDHDPEIRVVAVGSGAEASSVQEHARKLGVLNANFFMIEAVSKSDVCAWFGACDLAYSTVADQPALSANSANKVFDALAAKRPIAINHQGWLADLIGETEVGVVTPATMPEVAALSVAAFLRDPAKQAQARIAAEHLAKTAFSRDVLFEDLERVLLSATAGVG